MLKAAKTLGILGLAGVLSGCSPKKGTANPDDYYPLILAALDGGRIATMIARNEFLAKGNFPGCVSMEAMIAGFSATGDALAGKLQDQMVIPGFELDLAECMALREENPAGNQEVGPLISGTAEVALTTAEFYAMRMQLTNCKKGTAALAAIAYIRGLVDPVVSQVESPGATMTIPAVSVPLDACG